MFLLTFMWHPLSWVICRYHSMFHRFVLKNQGHKSVVMTDFMMSESGWYCASEILRKIWQLTRFDPLEPSAEGHWSIPVYCHANRWIIGAIATSKPIHIRNPNAAKRNVLCGRLESQSALVTCVFTKCFFQVFLVFLVLREPPYCQHRDFCENSWKCGGRLY